MWDIIGYVEKEVSLLVRKGDLYYVLSHPWQNPSPIPLLLANPKAEAIKIAQDDLLGQLRIRAIAHAMNHACALSRGSLAGKPASSTSELVKESLKFALRRRKADLATAQDFIQMLMSCAILEPIPDSFWGACKSFMSGEAAMKLKTSLDALQPLQPGDDDWIKGVTAYLQRVKWMQNEFAFIQTVSRQMAVSYRDHECSQALNDLRMQSTGLIQREEIERDMQSLKPWQRSAIPTKKAIRIGPSSGVKKTIPKDEAGDKT